MNGLGTHDDCVPIRSYRAQDESLHSERKRDDRTNAQGNSCPVVKETIHHLLRGIHLAAAHEAFSLVDVLGLDRVIFYQFVQTAAER